MKLITNNTNINGHVSNDTVNEFEQTILSDSIVQQVKSINPLRFKIRFLLYRFLRFFFSFSSRKICKKFIDKPLKDNGHLLTIMMGLDVEKYRQYGLFTCHNRSIYLFDAWPHDYDKIVSFVETFKINFVFVSASQSAKVLNGILGNRTIVNWVPEGINPQEYKFNSFENKNIDVLALGRKYDLYHEKILPYFENNAVTYLYEKVKGQLIFFSRQEFINGLANAKISICVPSSITHPERSGNVETMTIRYLQSMASKCLVIGHAPKEMIELFGYNPVIEIDMDEPVEQIKTILSKYSNYIEFVEKNYKTVCKHHTWLNRWTIIKNSLSKDKEML